VVLPSLVGLSLLAVSAGPSAEGEAAVSTRAPKRKTPDDVVEERKKPFMLRWGPEHNQLDLGLFLGAFVLAPNHGLFDRGQGPQPRINRGAFDFGFRATYFPLKWVGVGFSTSVMPTRSPELDATARFFTVRGHVVGQGPWRLTPTIELGGGALGVRSSNSRLRATSGAFHWGPGLKFFINKWIAVRLDGRHIVTTDTIDSRNAHHGEILLGVDATLRFRRIVDRPQRYDADLDGVLNEDDECPTEAGVEPHGCPEDKDGDKDGIPDSRDRCPKEWGDTPSGCPIPDQDQDGILDSTDECDEEPETYNGFKDEDGCPDEEPQELKQFTGVVRGIRFASGKAVIRADSYRTLDRAAKVLKQYPEVRLEIVGHTDSTGSRETNVELSQRRAEAVKKYLAGKGIEESRLQVRGAGPDEPIGDNKTNAGRAQNRRIEFHLLKPGETTSARPKEAD
jgi:outer membrane protein OmpA-like peptidoglycan-associated protein